MVLAKSKNAVGLGNSLMNDRFGKGKGADRKKVSYNAAAIQRTGPGGEVYITNPSEEASWVKMRSITEQAALDEFLSTAELAGTDFTAEKLNNIKIIHTDQKNPYLLSAADERSAIRKHQKNHSWLTVPRRPKWDERTTREQLDILERQSLLDWRRGLAELQENQDLLMTPFERNLEVWRQLWRVIERSDLIVQIVDARNPLLFRSEDLERYVKEVDRKKRNLLLVNKADMMSLDQRQAWADYFEEQGISYKFFSASLAKDSNEAKLFGDVESEGNSEEEETLAEETPRIDIQDRDQGGRPSNEDSEMDDDGGLRLPQTLQASRSRILTVDELEAYFLSAVPSLDTRSEESARSSNHRTTIGLVGYPNVGKSSTINTLLGAKRVSVSATPGKTKHFQTHYLSPKLILCDCPGLVFPNFATTKAELVVNGVLPIDQLREFNGPAGLVAQRIPKHFLEAVYGIKIYTRPLEEGGTGIPTAGELLRAYARARGFATTGQGQPDESRAARKILKDYVNGKLLFCHPPPISAAALTAGKEPIDPHDFNRGLYDISHLPLNRRQAVLGHSSLPTISGINESIDVETNDIDTRSDGLSLPSAGFHQPQSSRSRELDDRFFTSAEQPAGHFTMPFSYQYTEQGANQKRKELSGRKARTVIALERGIDVSEVRTSGKKHFKGGRRKARAKAKGKVGVGEDPEGY